MPTSRITVSGELGGASLNSTIVRTAVGQITQTPIALSAAKAGTLSTRSSDTAGTLTLGEGHGITDADVIDIYWADGMCYSAVVGTVDGTSVPFTGASGDVLPTEDDAITACVTEEIDSDFDGTLLVAIGARCDQKAHVTFMATAAVVLEVDLVANEAWFWVNGGTAVNPLDSEDVTSILVSQGSTSAATMRIGGLYDSMG